MNAFPTLPANTNTPEQTDGIRVGQSREDRAAPQEGGAVLTCSYCEAPCDGAYTIHRDGYNKGPEVPLCQPCGTGTYPSLQEIWARIADPDPLIEAMREVLQQTEPKENYDR